MLTIVEFTPRKVERRQYTQEELHAAFGRVQNKSNWKNPISRLVTVENDDDIELITQAVIHFTGSIPEFVLTECRWRDDGKKRYRVTAAGYYATIGA